MGHSIKKKKIDYKEANGHCVGSRCILRRRRFISMSISPRGVCSLKVLLKLHEVSVTVPLIVQRNLDSYRRKSGEKKRERQNRN